MYPDVVDLRAFYGEHLGQIARRLILGRLKRCWPSVAGDRVVGLGFATPYLADFSAGAERVLAFMPAVQGVVNWPPDGANVAALIEDDALPLRDASVDRVLAIHSLEMASDASNHLREIWRVLSPGGRMLLVVPNRRGIWARGEKTPFGYGRPFSRGQLTELLREASFMPQAWSEALAVPPIPWRPFVRSGRIWEQVGITLWPVFAGAIIVEASKQLYQGVPARIRPRLRPSLRPALMPPGASARKPSG
ncbi:MAG: class I SAM-dependent methyltransferase [Rhizobiales bacterium]|jgi:SAM-dependent methyltransferase|nr:class I SAM-dependent methyltransferase [Hyphomicrobiales bacterium]MBN9010178.1 class I SAM-dependent methyltransferase [Hyphomicrobiales bacterium]